VRRFGFCDRCGAMTEFPAWRVSVCYPCELGMNSIAAALTPRWARPMTSDEIHLACAWAIIEQGQPKRVAA
jgi:hypothetical protein